jgi:membrane protease YdiL (CAAX protease family)
MIWMQFFSSSWNGIPLPQPLKTSLFMWGPGIAALLCWKYLKVDKGIVLNRYYLFTGGVLLNIIIYSTPMLIFVIFYFKDLETNQIIFFLTLFNIVGFLNTFGEELGWRGFLQPNLKSLQTTKRFLLLGLMWEIWHLPMRIGALHNGANPIYILYFSIGTILLTFLIGLYVERSKSVTTAIGLHFVANLIMSLSSISKIPQQSLIPYFLTVIFFYLIIYLFWDRIKSKG